MVTSHSPQTWPGDPQVNFEVARSFGLTETEWAAAKKHVGRTPTYTELGVFSVMWSEHCSYKSSRVHLKRLPTTGPRVVQGPGENAGAVDIGHGYCAVFKMESHNHPSFIEPYQGAATGVGGILRDVFTMGARPVALLNSLRFGSPEHPLTPKLLRGVVAGIGGYGNCMGVPTVGGEVQFDASYNGNILVNAFCVGIAKSDKLFFGRAEGVGNAVLYVGARTGRDGIHGATMASQEFDDESQKKLPTVQVGDPFMQKLLLEACLEIFERDCLEGVQDMGAAGLTSSSVEMAARAGNGIELDLDAIPRRTQGLSPYEMLLSESQERMLMVAKPGRQDEVFAICKKWDLDVAMVGRVTNTARFVCKATAGFDPWDNPLGKREPQTVVDIPIAALTDAAPQYDRPQKKPVVSTELHADYVRWANNASLDIKEELLNLLASPNLGSRRAIYRQYDHIVRDGTVIRPGQADAAVIRVFTEDAGVGEKFLALSADCNGRHVELDAYQGAAMAVAECARNLVCTGAEPLALTDCLNFGSPENPETMARFAQAIEGMRDACLTFGTPVVSGNVSLYNETEGKAILPTPTVAMVGQLHNANDRLSMSFKQSGDRVALLGVNGAGQLGGSEWLTQKAGKLLGPAQSIDLEAELRLQKLLLELAQKRLLQSAHDVSDGGLLIALAECCMAGNVGCSLNLPLPQNVTPSAYLFSEEPSRIVISFSASQESTLVALAQTHQVPIEALGTVADKDFTIHNLCTVPVTDLVSRYESALDRFFA